VRSHLTKKPVDEAMGVGWRAHVLSVVWIFAVVFAAWGVIAIVGLPGGPWNYGVFVLLVLIGVGPTLAIDAYFQNKAGRTPAGRTRRARSADGLATYRPRRNASSRRGHLTPAGSKRRARSRRSWPYFAAACVVAAIPGIDEALEALEALW
jgi:hypothetical protein